MNYNLNKHSKRVKKKRGFWESLRKLADIIATEKQKLTLAFVAILLNVVLSLLGPYLLGYTIDTHVQTKNYEGILIFSGILLVIYICAYLLNYVQIRMMGGIGQRLLFGLRNNVFEKLQELPLDFFNQNKAGDLISRINNDTDNLSDFFSHSLMQFIRSLVMMIGAGVFLLSLNLPLGLATLSPTLLLLVFTITISPWIRRKNKATLKSLGNLSAEIQEGLASFKVIVAFDRRDYFRKRLDKINNKNYKISIHAGIANSLLSPIYTFASNIGQLIVLTLGIWLITQGRFSIGLLISFIAYVSNFYNPLRQLARFWANFQLTLAAWDRISQLLALESNLPISKEASKEHSTSSVVHFKNVSFAYPNGEEVLKNVSFDLKRGKTYAFVGPTGGGKTTTASLISRLYDVTKGTILLHGKDIKTYTASERAEKIGFILQDPILFTDTLRNNILYGNTEYKSISDKELKRILDNAQLLDLLKSFEQGLDTPITMGGDSISLGQKQIIAFIRAILRKPDLLILDEATANIDTVTEKQLEAILSNLPKSTTKVIIAHRLNTIKNADEIFFVNSQKIITAGSFDEAVELIMQEQGVS